MALIDARQLRSLKVSERKSDKNTRQYSGSEDFLILADSKDPSFVDILKDNTSWPNLGSNKLPQINDEIVIRGVRFYVTSRDLAHYKDNERAVVMSVKYDSKEEDDDEPPEPPEGTDPETWQRITVQSEQVTEPAKGWTIFPDTVGKPQVGGGQTTARNSAGDPVDGLEEDTALVRFTYTNTQVLDPNFVKLQEYTNKCNSVPFLGGIEYTIRCMGWSGEYDQKNNVWSISIDFLYKPNNWSIEFADAGFNEIIDDKRRAILDVKGNPVSTPVPLNGNGVAAVIGNGGSSDDFQPVQLRFRYLFPYPSVDLNNIFNDCRM